MSQSDAYPYRVVDEGDDYVSCYLCGPGARARVFLGAFLPMCVPCAHRLAITLTAALREVTRGAMHPEGVPTCRCGHADVEHGAFSNLCHAPRCTCKGYWEQGC